MVEISSPGRLLQEEEIDDPIELVDLQQESGSFYDTFKIIEKLSMEMPKQHKSQKKVKTSSKTTSKPSLFRKKRNHQKGEEKQRDSIDIIPLEERWSFVVDYHKQHSSISESELQERFQLLLSARNNQTKMEDDPAAKYLIYYPRQAGIGNTLLALAHVLLLSIASNRRFLGRSVFR